MLYQDKTTDVKKQLSENFGLYIHLQLLLYKY